VIRFLRRDAKSPTPKGTVVPPVDVTPPPDRSPSLAPEAALARADELYAQGDAIEAIALLTAANATRRDHRIERRLVTMRFDAFQAAQWPQTRPAVPDAVQDLFPGTVIPEIDPRDLDVAHVRSALLNHGSLIVRGLVGPERVAQLTADIDRALAGYDAWFAGKGLATAAPWFEPFAHEPKKVERKFRRDVGGVLVVDSPPSLFDVIETFDAAGIRGIVTEFFGEQPALLAKKWTLRRVPHDTGDSGWHQDGSFMGGDIRSLNVWLALSHCGDNAPGLDVVGRRLDDIVPTGTEGAWLDWNVSPLMVEQVAPGAVVRPIFEAGDALIFDHFNLHRTAAGPDMTNDRYAIEAWFLAPSTYELMMAGDGAEGAPPRDQLPMIY
jgi:Phytanoyl-CoA dioxygenase (PhyH)